MIDEKTSNNKQLILQPNYLNLNLNPGLLRMSIRRYHSPLLKAFSRLKLTLAISAYNISTVFTLQESTWPSRKGITKMSFCWAPLFGFCQKRSIAKGREPEPNLWLPSLVITGFHFALHMYLTNVEMNGFSFVGYAWHIAVNKKDVFSNDPIIFKGKKKEGVASHSLSEYLLKTYYVPSGLIGPGRVKK